MPVDAAIAEPPAKSKEGPQKTKRFSLNLPMKLYLELDYLANDTDRNMTEIVRFGLALVKLYLEESAKGNKLIIAASDGKAVSEIRFPA
jgi:hypothetical protein